MGKKTPNSYVFILHRFQEIMELCCEPSFWGVKAFKPLAEDRYKMCMEYKDIYRLENYPNAQIWRIIRNKYFKWWDELFWDICEWEKDKNYKSPKEK